MSGVGRVSFHLRPWQTFPSSACSQGLGNVVPMGCTSNLFAILFFLNFSVLKCSQWGIKFAPTQGGVAGDFLKGQCSHADCRDLFIFCSNYKGFPGCARVRTYPTGAYVCVFMYV